MRYIRLTNFLSEDMVDVPVDEVTGVATGEQGETEVEVRRGAYYAVHESFRDVLRRIVEALDEDRGEMTVHERIALVRDWHEAVNSGDTDRLANLVSDDVEIGGPRGLAHGRDVLIDWVERTGIRMESTDWYQRGETVIVCQQATWPTEDGTPGVPSSVGSVFVVRDGQIESIARYPDLIQAFAATGLAETDRVRV